MRCRFILTTALAVSLSATAAWAQTQMSHWRGAGPSPCVGPDGGILQCTQAEGVIAIRAGHLFDSNTGQMLTKQLVIVSGERIAEVGSQAGVKIPAGVHVIDLGNATLLPGLIDGHEHMFDTRKPDGTTATSVLIAVHNLQADLQAGFTTERDMSTHGNGYDDVAIRDAVHWGLMDGPRLQVSTRGIVWGDKPPSPATPDNSLASTVVRSVADARAAVRDQIDRGADWIKLFPGNGYSFTSTGEVKYKMTYPMPVLKALVDETHLLGHKVACHVFGGQGLKNAISAGCDTIEHGFALTQEEADTMARKGIYYDPTLVRYTIPAMDDNDAKSTGSQYRIVPIFERDVSMAVATRGLKIMLGSGADGSMYAHGTQVLDLEALVKIAGMSPSRAIQSATIINAEALGWQHRIGSIDKGKYADLIAVCGDPLADIAALQQVKFVMKGGKVIKNDIMQSPCR